MRPSTLRYLDALLCVVLVRDHNKQTATNPKGVRWRLWCSGLVVWCDSGS